MINNNRMMMRIIYKLYMNSMKRKLMKAQMKACQIRIKKVKKLLI